MSNVSYYAQLATDRITPLGQAFYKGNGMSVMRMGAGETRSTGVALGRAASNGVGTAVMPQQRSWKKGLL